MDPCLMPTNIPIPEDHEAVGTNSDRLADYQNMLAVVRDFLEPLRDTPEARREAADGARPAKARRLHWRAELRRHWYICPIKPGWVSAPDSDSPQSSEEECVVGNREVGSTQFTAPVQPAAARVGRSAACKERADSPTSPAHVPRPRALGGDWRSRLPLLSKPSQDGGSIQDACPQASG